MSESPAAVIASVYVALYEDGDVRSSHRQILAALESIRDRGVRVPSEVFARLVNQLLVISQYANDETYWETGS